MGKQPSGPNVLFLLTDDQRFDTIRRLGAPHMHTPTMDWLSQRGVGFDSAYIMGGTCQAVCMPSRAMLNTGRTMFHIQGDGEDVPADHVLMGEHFGAQGYRTFVTGKWHNGPAALARAFSCGDEIFFGGMDDHWNVPACHYAPAGQYPVPRPHRWDPGTGKVLQTPQQYDHVTEGKHSTELFADAAVDFVRGYRDPAPFFMYVAFMAPHDPRTMPQQYRNLYDADAVRLPDSFMGEHPFDNGEMEVRDELLAARPRQPAEIRRHLADYYSMISHLDAAIGRIIDALKARNVLENTIIVLTGDNGLAIGRHGLMGKQSLYDHSVHVPLVMAGPGVPVDERRTQPCYLIDLFPTLCDLTGLPIPATVEGRSLVAALRSPRAVHRESLHFAYRHLHRGVMKDRLKLIECCVAGERHTQLFDLAVDPWELTNLADKPAHRAELAAMRRELAQWRTRYDDPQPEFGALYREWG
jgi:arylsulfatase A-like enzyme